MQTAVTMDSTIDQTLLAEMNAQQSIWEHYGFSRQDFVALLEPQKNALIAKYYSDKIKSGFIDSSIGSKITKTHDGSKTEMQVEMTGSSVKQKQLVAWPRNGFFTGDCDNFKVVKANMPENTVFYMNQAYITTKDGKKYHYNDLYVIEQLMSLAPQAQQMILTLIYVLITRLKSSGPCMI